jgi:hypothetical protein
MQQQQQQQQQQRCLSNAAFLHVLNVCSDG